MSKKLTKDESKTIQFLVSEFNRFWQSINEKERELTLLEERKTGIQSELTMLLAEINQVRAKEKEFTNKINNIVSIIKISIIFYFMYIIVNNFIIFTRFITQNKKIYQISFRLIY